jgi:signal transduction histidine kinase
MTGSLPSVSLWWNSMNEVIRLIRLTLVLRVAVSVLGAVVALTLLPTITPVMFDLVAIVPSLLLLAVSFIAPGRGWNTIRFAKSLLIAMIVVEALEAIITRLGFQLYLGASGMDMGDFFRRLPGAPSDIGLMRLPLNVPQVFIAIPALLGAWIDGRRGSTRWAAFTVLMSLLSTISTTSPEFTQWRLNVGVFGAQAMVVVITCYFVASLADQQRDEQKQIEQANKELSAQSAVREQLATSRERVRLARDLHDTLAHTLAGLVVESKVIDTLLEKDPAAARRELVKMQGVAKHGLEEARAAIGDLRANIVEDLGLSNALQRQVELLGKQTTLEVSYERKGDEPQLDKSCGDTLFRIVQEALNNAERHAHASQVKVIMDCAATSEHALNIAVKDNGVGFDVGTLDDERFGLRGMRERAELIGAHLRIDSIVGRGTTVTVTLKQQS